MIQQPLEQSNIDTTLNRKFPRSKEQLRSVLSTTWLDGYAKGIEVEKRNNALAKERHEAITKLLNSSGQAFEAVSRALIALENVR